MNIDETLDHVNSRLDELRIPFVLAKSVGRSLLVHFENTEGDAAPPWSFHWEQYNTDQLVAIAGQIQQH